MVKMTTPATIEARYCHTGHTTFASGDQLCYLLDDNWSVVEIDHEIYLKRGRRVIVYVFTLYRNGEYAEISIVSTPYIARLAKSYIAEHYQNNQTLKEASYTA